MPGDKAHVIESRFARIRQSFRLRDMIAGSPQTTMGQGTAAADQIVLLADDDPEAGIGRRKRGGQASRAGAEDNKIALDDRVG